MWTSVSPWRADASHVHHEGVRRRGFSLRPRAAARSFTSDITLGKRRAARGRTVQVDSIKPVLKAPGPMHLKLKHGKPLSSFAVKSS